MVRSLDKIRLLHPRATLHDVPLSRIDLHDRRFRVRLSLDIGQLQQCLNAEGQLVPVVLRAQGKCYQVVSGFRRLAAIQALGWSFAWGPVALNSVILLALAVIFNRLAGRQYPHHPAKPAGSHDTADPMPSRRGGIRSEDLDIALASYGELLDIDRGDLEEILLRAQLQA